MQALDRPLPDYRASLRRRVSCGTYMSQYKANDRRALGTRPIARVFQDIAINARNTEVTWARTDWYLRTSRAAISVPLAFVLLIGSLATSAAAEPKGAQELAKKSLNNNEPKAALRHLAEAIHLDPNNASLYFMRAVAHTQLGRTASGMRDLNETIRLDPNYAAAFRVRGALLAELHKDNAAIADLDEAIRLGHTHPQLHLVRGAIFLRRGNLKEAITQFDKAIEIDPTHANTYYYRGQGHLEQGDLHRALQDMEEASRLQPSQASAHAGKGLVHYKLGQLDAALSSFQRAIDLDPRSPVGFVGRGQVYAQRGYLHAAVRDFSAALGLAPERVDALANRASVYSELEDFNAALRDYTSAIHLEPENAKLYVNRSLEYAQVGRIEDAMADATRALGANPALLPAFSLTWRRQETNHWHDAIQKYEGRVAAQPGNPEGHLLLGHYLALTGDVKEGRVHLEKAAKLGMRDHDLSMSLGRVYVQTGHIDEAIAWFTDAIALVPHSKTAVAHRGYAHLQKGEHESASRDFRKLHEIANAGAVPCTVQEPAFVWVKVDTQLRDDMGEPIEAVRMGDILFAKDMEGAHVRVRVPRLLLAEKGTEGRLALHEVVAQDAAIEFFTKTIDEEPGNARAYLGRATALHTAPFPVGTVRQVMDDLDHAVRIAPQLTAARLWRASLAVRNNDFEGAIDDYTEIIKQGHGTAWVFGARGHCWLRLANGDKALADLNRAVRLDPNEPRFYQWRAAAHLIAGRPALAIRDITAARKLGLEVTEGVLYLEVVAHIENGALAEAVDVAHHWIDRFPRSPNAYSMLGTAHLLKGEWSDALQFYDQALTYSPNAMMALNGKAWVLATVPDERVRDGHAGVRLARHASRLMRDEFSPALATLAAAHAEVREFEEAVQWQKKAIELAPEANKEPLRKALELYESGKPFRSTPGGHRPPWHWTDSDFDLGTKGGHY